MNRLASSESGVIKHQGQATGHRDQVEDDRSQQRNREGGGISEVGIKRARQTQRARSMAAHCDSVGQRHQQPEEGTVFQREVDDHDGLRDQTQRAAAPLHRVVGQHGEAQHDVEAEVEPDNSIGGLQQRSPSVALPIRNEAKREHPAGGHACHDDPG